MGSDEFEEEAYQAAQAAGEALGRLIAALVRDALREIDLEDIVREELGAGIREAAREELEDILTKNRLVVLSALGGAIPEALEELRGQAKGKAKKSQ